MHYCTSFKEQDEIEHFRCCLQLREKFSRIFFPSMWFLFFLASIAFFFLSPTTKTIPITSAIIDDTITWIFGCIGFYKFLPYYVRFKRRKWYRKILQRKNYAIRVLILASHLELYNSEGKPVIFIYKAQIKKGKRNLPKKHQMIGEIIEAKNGIYFVGSDIELIDIGPILFVAKNDVPAEDYSKLREMLKGVFLEKYYDYSAE